MLLCVGQDIDYATSSCIRVNLPKSCRPVIMQLGMAGVRRNKCQYVCNSMLEEGARGRFYEQVQLRCIFCIMLKISEYFSTMFRYSRNTWNTRILYQPESTWSCMIRTAVIDGIVNLDSAISHMQMWKPYTPQIYVIHNIAVICSSWLDTYLIYIIYAFTAINECVFKEICPEEIFILLGCPTHRSMIFSYLLMPVKFYSL